MLAIGISEFRANTSAILQRVQNGEIISLFVGETEVAKLIPPDYSRLIARHQLERLRRSAVVGDLLSPVDDGWDVLA